MVVFDLRRGIIIPIFITLFLAANHLPQTQWADLTIPACSEKLRKIGGFVADRLPTVIIVGLIALYYIQLSNMV